MKYPYMSYQEIETYLPDIEKYDVSKTARGIIRSNTTDKGFLEVYKNIKNPADLYNKKMATEKQSWGKRRDDYISRHLVQYNRMPTLRRKLSLIAWAYKP
jgi:hypothetical protein